jgi:hypothetical protein
VASTNRRAELTTVTKCNPRDGSYYGFPKEIPEEALRSLPELESWFRAQGYPQNLIDDGALLSLYTWQEEI